MLWRWQQVLLGRGDGPNHKILLMFREFPFLMKAPHLLQCQKAAGCVFTVWIGGHVEPFLLLDSQDLRGDTGSVRLLMSRASHSYQCCDPPAGGCCLTVCLATKGMMDACAFPLSSFYSSVQLGTGGVIETEVSPLSGVIVLLCILVTKGLDNTEVFPSLERTYCPQLHMATSGLMEISLPISCRRLLPSSTFGYWRFSSCGTSGCHCQSDFWPFFKIRWTWLCLARVLALRGPFIVTTSMWW